MEAAELWLVESMLADLLLGGFVGQFLITEWNRSPTCHNSAWWY